MGGPGLASGEATGGSVTSTSGLRFWGGLPLSGLGGGLRRLVWGGAEPGPGAVEGCPLRARAMGSPLAGGPMSMAASSGRQVKPRALAGLDVLAVLLTGQGRAIFPGS